MDTLMNVSRPVCDDNESLSDGVCHVDEMDKKKHLTIKKRLELLNGVFPMDEAVVEALPEASIFRSVEHFGHSAWTITGRVRAINRDGEEQSYFLKVAFEDQGMVMLHGEYESSKVIHGVMNDFLPKPYGFGRYKVQDPPTYFYLSEFVDMDLIKKRNPIEFAKECNMVESSNVPDPVEFTKRLAQLHKLSESPTGKFGFEVPTCDGQVARTVDWEDNWAVFFRKLLLETCRRDVETNGPWPEMERATTQIADVVIPRLLGPLQENGRKLKPCIIHGDLWEGNMGIVKRTKRSILFDVGSYYAHNEMELGHWRCEFSSVFSEREYTDTYQAHYPPSEPAEQFDDRNRLYSLQGAINYSAGHPGSKLRKTAYNNMCYLCDEYAPMEGIDKYDPGVDPVITGERITPHLANGLL